MQWSLPTGVQSTASDLWRRAVAAEDVVDAQDPERKLLHLVRPPGPARAVGRRELGVDESLGEVGVRELPVGDVEVACQHQWRAVVRDQSVGRRSHDLELVVTLGWVVVQRDGNAGQVIELCRHGVRADDHGLPPQAEIEPCPDHRGF